MNNKQKIKLVKFLRENTDFKITLNNNKANV